MVNTTTIKSIQAGRKVKIRNKAIAITFLAILLINIGCSAVSASETAWGLNTSQVDVSYFYSGGTGSSLDTDYWSTPRQNAWIICKELASSFNDGIVNTNKNRNSIYQMEYIYDNYDDGIAASYGKSWNNLKTKIQNMINQVAVMVGTERSVPVVDNKTITTSEYQSLYNQCQSLQDSLDELKDAIYNTYETALFSNSGAGRSFAGGILDIFNQMWNALGKMIKYFGTGNVSTNNILGMSWTSSDIESIANTVNAVVKTFAYAIAVCLFGINVTSTALQYELLTLRGGIRIFGRVLLVKVWIDLAVKICIYILGLVNGLAQSIFSLFTVNSSSISKGYLIDINDSSNVFTNVILQAIQGIVNFFTDILTFLPTIALLCVATVCVVSVVIKLISRAFELTCLVSLSPIFFATLVGEESKQYFKKFMNAFLSTAAYIVYMAIVYAVATSWISECSSYSASGTLSSIAVGFLNLAPRFLIIIACCLIMRKPPKVLTSLLEG